MATFLVIHEPLDGHQEEVADPSDIEGLAKSAADGSTPARWLAAWTPASADDRLFTLWETDDPDSIAVMLARYRFLEKMTPEIIPVRGWNADDVLRAAGSENNPPEREDATQ